MQATSLIVIHTGGSIDQNYQGPAKLSACTDITTENLLRILSQMVNQAPDIHQSKALEVSLLAQIAIMG